ncbi:hypothetical protein F5887DRAFT_624166 [Amanita rubescens]|nr:hypothetical protein F5887DRAFT_624166 [Amanita rubescens]
MPRSLSGVEVTSLVCSSLAICSTLIRLALRMGRLWADDASATFSMLSLVIQLSAVFLPSESIRARLGVARYYLMAITFYLTIWSARLSLLFSIIRIDPNPIRRKFLIFNAYIFALVCVLLVAQIFWICEPQRKWKSLKPPQCHVGLQVALLQLVTDVLADLTLLITPICLFRNIRDKWLRYRLVAIFSTCMVTTIVSLVHALYILTAGGPRLVIAAIVENCTSLIVCNVPVIASAAIHLGDNYSARKGPRCLESVTFTSCPASQSSDTEHDAPSIY